MYLIGLTGGIASGKSAVAARLASWGAVHLDADRFARDAVDPGTERGASTLAQIADSFGSMAIRADGTLDRRRVGDRIFADPAARKRLNDIVHPAIRAVSDDALAAVRESQPEALVLYEASLLVESRKRLPFDVVMTTSAPVGVQIERLTRMRGLTATAARRRVLAQASDAERRAIADIVIATGGPWEETERELVDVWVQLRALSMVEAG
jgi:dephospho-CoA kinase